MGLGITEIAVIFLIVLLFFGAKRLPEIARAMGKASNEFKRAKNEVISSVTEDIAETDINQNRTESKTEEKKVYESK